MVRCFLIHTVCPVSALGAGESRLLYSRLFGPDEGIFSDRERGLSPAERRLSPEERRLSPEERRLSPEERRLSPEERRLSPEERRLSPEERRLSPEERRLSPEERRLSPEERRLSPEERRLVQKERIAVVARQVRSAVSLSREASARVLVDTVPGEEALALQDADSGVVRLRAGDPFSEEMSALYLGVQSLGFTLVCEPHENLLLAEITLRNLTRHCLEHLHMLGQGSEVLLRSNRVDALLSRLLPHGQLLFLNHRFAQALEKEVTAYMAK